MKDIRLDNQLLIQECSNIRENLEDILKNINDIEKKFIELTNNNSFLIEKDNLQLQDIKVRIKDTKSKVLLKDEDKQRVGRMNKNDKLPPINKNKGPQNLVVKGGENGNIDSLNTDELLKMQKENTKEFMRQQNEIDKMQQNLRERMGDQTDTNNLGNSSNFIKNIDEGRHLTIKSKKYYDVKEGNIKK